MGSNEKWISWGLVATAATLYDRAVRHENGGDLYRVIHKSLRDFRTRLRNNQDRHGRKEHINR